MSTTTDLVLSDSSCAVGLRSETWEAAAEHSPYDIPEFAIYVEVFAGSLDDACEKTFICRDDHGAWWIEGRMGTRDGAASISSTAWHGVRGVSETGRYWKEGGYAGPAKAFVALLDSRDGRLALVIADNEMNDELLFSRILQSFLFTD